jgi:hypothetical protein
MTLFKDAREDVRGRAVGPRSRNQVPSRWRASRRSCSPASSRAYVEIVEGCGHSTPPGNLHARPGTRPQASAGASQREIRDPMTFDSFECANGSLGRRLARGQLPDLPRHAEGAVRPVPCIASNRTGRSCMHYFVHCLVGCTPYISITEVLWQQLGYVMKVLAAKVVRQLEGKRLDLFELCFVECKKHSPLLPRS